LTSGGYAQVRIKVDASRPGEAISPTMYGVFFEDINFGADGGLYAELIKNRSFEFDQPLRGWRVLKQGGADGRVYAVRNVARPRNPRYLRIEIDKRGDGFGLRNEGFRGMGVRKGVLCNLSLQIRLVKGDVNRLEAELVGADKAVLAECPISGLTEDWQTLKCGLVPSETDAKATLNILFQGEGTVDIDMVSLFPTNTWKKRENGLRADMGHPRPFNMKMLGIGNEQWGPQYIERYIPFAGVIKDKYPEIELIAATGSDGTIFPNGEAEIEYLWEQWRPDLIWFDNLKSYGSVNYHVQKLFSLNSGTHMLSSQVSGAPGINEKSRVLNVSAVWDKNTREVIVKSVNAGENPLTARVNLEGVQAGATMKVTVLSSEKLTDENTLEEPRKIVPRETIAEIPGTEFDVEFKPYSFTLLRIPVKENSHE
jgi:hypothetical protein